MALHRSQLYPTLAALKTRLKTQARLDEDGSLDGALMRSRFLSQGGLTTYDMLAQNPVVAIATAARRALTDINWVASSEEKQEELEAAGRVRTVLARKEVEECAYMQALMLADPESGIGIDGSMGQCFFCNNFSDECMTAVICCEGCICVFHQHCLCQRGVQINEEDPLSRCPVCVARELAECDPSKQSVLALTARGSNLRVALKAVPPSPAQPARRKRPRPNEAAAAPAPNRQARSQPVASGPVPVGVDLEHHQTWQERPSMRSAPTVRNRR